MLGRLVDRGFLKASENGFMFRREEEGLTHRVQELERFYATHLIPISNLIHSKASARIQEFADAFTFKRKK